MNLLELRESLVRQSGRYDLVGYEVSEGERIPDYTTDKGANAFISRAVKRLSNEIRIKDNLQVVQVIVDEATAGLAIPGLLQVAEEGVTLDGEPLNKSNQARIFSRLDVDIVHTGKPKLWFRITRKPGVPTGFVSDEVNYNLGLYPIPDKEYKVTVSCWTYDALLEDEDENWWSVYHPESIVDVACSEIDATNLNADRRVIEQVIDRVRFNLLSRDVLEDVIHRGNIIA